MIASWRCKMTRLQNFLREESGVTAIEYGLIAAGIGVAIVTVVFTVGSALVGIFSTVQTKLGG
jgi:pilus assembly protein Flp/PilA